MMRTWLLSVQGQGVTLEQSKRLSSAWRYTHTVVNNHTKTKLSIVGINRRLHFGFYHSKTGLFIQFTNGFQTLNHRIPTLVWNFTYSADLKSGSFQIPNGQKDWFTNGLNFEWGLKSGSLTILNRDKWPPFCQTGPFEIPSLKYSDFQCFSVSNDQISDPRCLSLQNVFFPPRLFIFTEHTL